MASQLTLSIVTPERELVRAQVDEVELPGSEGYFGVLPGHTPMLATLTVGRLTVLTHRIDEPELAEARHRIVFVGGELGTAEAAVIFVRETYLAEERRLDGREGGGSHAALAT